MPPSRTRETGQRSHTPRLAGEHLQPIDMLCRSYSVIAIDYAPCIIYDRPIYVNSKVLYYL